MTSRGESLARGNVLLAALDDDSFAAVAEVAEEYRAAVRDMVYDIGTPIEHVLFPIDAVYSMLSVMQDDRSVEIATVGREGFVGVPVLLEGGFTSEHQAFAQVGGTAVRIPTLEFRQLVGDLPALRTMLHRYTLALLAQIGQASACNRLHTLDERCARWLLMTHDRVGRDEFPLTQEFLAQMLGVRRAGVNQAQQVLSDAGVISYVRGNITVLDRPGLERHSCECYQLIRAEHDRLARFDPAVADNY
jgi:CRP-like cAMP-binding protein